MPRHRIRDAGAESDPLGAARREGQGDVDVRREVLAVRQHQPVPAVFFDAAREGLDATEERNAQGPELERACRHGVSFG